MDCFSRRNCSSQAILVSPFRRRLSLLLNDLTNVRASAIAGDVPHVSSCTPPCQHAFEKLPQGRQILGHIGTLHLNHDISEAADLPVFDDRQGVQLMVWYGSTGPLSEDVPKFTQDVEKP